MWIVNGLLPWVAVRSIRSGFRPTTATCGKPVDNVAQVEAPVVVVKHSNISSDVIGIREIRIEHDVVGRDIRQIELMSTQAKNKKSLKLGMSSLAPKTGRSSAKH